MESSDRFFLLALSLPSSHVAYIFVLSLRCLGQARKLVFINWDERLCCPLPPVLAYSSVYACPWLLYVALSTLSAHCLLKKRVQVLGAQLQWRNKPC